MKLVFVTPPICKVVEYEDRSEVLWEASAPFTFDEAPLLIDNGGNSDFPLLVKTLMSARRSTWLGRFSSKFRSRTAFLASSRAEAFSGVLPSGY
jgi:hypothetical protein